MAKTKFEPNCSLCQVLTPNSEISPRKYATKKSIFRIVYFNTGTFCNLILNKRTISVKQIVYNLNISEKIEECIISTDEDPSIRIERSKNLRGVSTKLN